MDEWGKHRKVSLTLGGDARDKRDGEDYGTRD